MDKILYMATDGINVLYNSKLEDVMKNLGYVNGWNGYIVFMINISRRSSIVIADTVKD